MNFPTPHTVETHALMKGSKDSHGNPAKSWADGVTQAVMGWAPATGDVEPVEVGRTAVIRDLDVFAPVGFIVGPHDRVTVDGDLYDVVGHPEDFNHGPFGFAPGYRVGLKRVEG